MILIEDLLEIARMKGLRNKGYVEKDYAQDLILLSLSKNTKDELVFKGGTCLFKFYKLNRFSEDLDFTLRKELDVDGLIQKVISDLALFGIEAEIKEQRKVYTSIRLTLRIKGPLYKGNPRTVSSIRLDINTQSSIDTEPMLLKINSLYPDVPTFSLFVMSEKEILAEKVRAILTRMKARDVYDLYFLLQKGVAVDTTLIEKKLEYYDLKWDSKAFVRKLNMKKEIWESELGPLIANVPDFKDVKKCVVGLIK